MEEIIAYYDEEENEDDLELRPDYERIGFEVINADVPPKDAPDFDDCFGETAQGRKTLIADKLVAKYCDYRDIVTYNNKCFTLSGFISDSEIKHELYFILSSHGISSNMAKTFNDLLTSIKSYSFIKKMDVEEKVIPIANGDLIYEYPNKFIFDKNPKVHRPYRLPIELHDTSVFSSYQDIPPRFTSWLHDTFYPEDIETVQMILGYCLIPATKAQEMFLFEGDAGVGKTGVKRILDAILGDSFAEGSIYLLSTDKFRTAQIENKLVLYDDELNSQVLHNTDFFKKVVTNEGKITVEQKGVQAYSIKSYCKIICSTNQDFITTEENSNEGFFRRVHPICIKPRNPKRRNIEGFYDMMLEDEAEYIFRWILLGASNVFQRQFEIPWSQRSRDFINKMRKDAMNIPDFLEERCEFDKGYSVTSVNLYDAYRTWCRENMTQCLKQRTFKNWLENDGTLRYGLVSTNHAKRPDGTEARGYKGIKLKN